VPAAQGSRDAFRHKVPAVQGGILRCSALPVGAPALGSGFRSTAWSPQLAQGGVHPFKVFVSVALLMLQLISQLCLERTALSLSCAFFTVAKKSHSKQNSQAPDETCLRREFSHLSVAWCFAKRHVLKSWTPGNSNASFAETQNKMGFLGVTHC